MITKTLELEIEELKEEIKERDEIIAELKKEIKKLEDEEIDDSGMLNHSFRGIEEIQWSAPNLLDSMVMEALEDAFDKYNHHEIIEKLK